jgi:peptide/nickel transport system permease protein
VRVLLERAIRAAVLLFGVSLLSFLLLEAAPGDFFDELRLNRQIDPATIAALRAEYGLDAPLLTRYARWVTAALHGHFGYSLHYRVPVERLLWPRAGNTLLLTGVALALAWVLALGVGLATAVTNRRWPDRLAGGIAAALLALPDVLITLVLLSIAAHSGRLPVGGMSSVDLAPGLKAAALDLARHMTVPVMILVISIAPGLLQHVRHALADAVPSPLAVALTARGLPRRRVIVRHALRLAAAPLAALGGLSVGTLLSASLLVEALVGWPGLGALLLEAVTARDEYVIVGATILSTVFLVCGNAIGDAVLYITDPRVRVTQ